MNSSKYRNVFVILALAGSMTTGSVSAADPAKTCASMKRKATSKYSACRYRAAEVADRRSEDPDYSRCLSRIQVAFSRAEGRAGVGVCASEGDVDAVIELTDRYTGDISDGIEGGAYAYCGNGTIDGDESCDGAQLGGQSCATLGFDSGDLNCTDGCGYDVAGCGALSIGGGVPTTGQLTSYGPGSDGDVQAGCAFDYTDNGDGTITDNCTGLMWEKKDDSGGLHDKDNLYSWSVSYRGTTMNGTIADYIDELNDAAGGGVNAFAGYSDWRVPSIKELASILVFSPGGVGVDTAFHKQSTCTSCSDINAPACTCSSIGLYWSSTTSVTDPSEAYVVNPNERDAVSNTSTYKCNRTAGCAGVNTPVYTSGWLHVRAVR